METTSELRVSIDVDCYHHSVAVGLPNGTLLEEFELANGQEGFDWCFERVDRLQQRYGVKYRSQWKGTTAGRGRWIRWSALAAIGCSASII